MLSRVVGVGYQFYGLNYVGVASDDVVYTLIDEPMGEGTLFIIGLLYVFVAPMYNSDNGIYIHCMGSVYIGCKFFAIKIVDDVGWYGGNAVSAVCGA